MALSILDGNQSATTLSTILSSGQHITAHTVVSLGTQAITDIVNATSAGLTNTQLRASAVTISGTVTANGLALGQEVLNVFPVGIGQVGGGGVRAVADFPGFRVPVSLGESQAVVSASLSDPLPAGTNRIGVVTIGAGTVTLGASTAQIGSVTASISGTVPVSGTFFQATQPVSLTTLPALVAGTAQIGSVTVGNTVTIAGTVTANPTGTQTIAGSVTLEASTSQIGSVTASISGTVPVSISSVTVGNSVTIGSLPTISGTVTANLSISSTVITSGSFTSLSSATLVPANTARKMATVYNLGAGQLFINAGASATTLGGGFMVALSSGDFYECDYTTTTLSAIFATAGTASWVSH
jgi:hypothetical protein